MGRKHPFNLFDPNFYQTIETVFIGADQFFNSLNEIHNTVTDNYPPYNMERDDDSCEITLAIAGFKKSEIEVKVEKHPHRVLVVSGTKAEEVKEKNANGISSIFGTGKEYVHKGIGARNFQRKFQLDEHWNVESVKLADGVLNVTLKHIIPEEKKPEVFDIK